MLEEIEGQRRKTTVSDLPVDELINLADEFSKINLDSGQQIFSTTEENPFANTVEVLNNSPNISMSTTPVVQEPQPAPTESFTAPVTNAVSGAADAIGNFGSALYDRARTFAPGFIGDNKNQAIVDRAKTNQ